jgi:hypothetical protein
MNRKCISNENLFVLSPLYVLMKFLTSKIELTKGKSMKARIPSPGVQGPEGVASFNEKIANAATT